MIRKKLHEITLQQYDDCLKGNTKVLRKYPIPFLTAKCNQVFQEVSEELSRQVKQGSNNVIIRMFERLHKKAIRLRLLTVCYQILQLKKHDDTIKIASKHGFKWNEKLTYADNLRVLSGVIDRLSNEIKQEHTRYENTMKKTETDAAEHSLYDVIVALNHIAGSDLTMKSSLAHFVAVNKLSKEIIKMNKNK